MASAEWRDRGRWLAVAVVVAAALFRWGGAVVGEGFLFDELAYLAGGRLLESGTSPYEQVKFLYPPAFAALIAAGQWWLGDQWLVGLLRLATLLGACAVAWLATRGTGWSRRARTAAAAVVVVLSPFVETALRWGNLSPLLVAVALAGLWQARRRPLAGGAWMGLANALKPMTLPALAVVAAAGGRRGWRAAGVGLAVAATLQVVAPWRFLGDFLARSAELPEQPGNVAPWRLLGDLGLALPAWLVMALITAAGMTWAWRARPPAAQEVALALGIAVLALPVVWAHTLIATYPAQALAMARALRAWRVSGPDGRARELIGVGAVAAAIAALHGAHGFGLLGTPWLVALLTPLPALALVGLLVYAVGVSPAVAPAEGETRGS